MDTCFSQNKELHKLFNRHNTNVSYICGVGPILKIQSILTIGIFQEFKQSKLKKKPTVKRKKRKNKKKSSDNCNCEAQECPINGECLDKDLMYEASVFFEGGSVTTI